jgi:hypothetical protein
MFAKKFNDRDDLVLFRFSERGIPLHEKVCGVDLPSHAITIDQSLYRVKSISGRRPTVDTKRGHADWAVMAWSSAPKACVICSGTDSNRVLSPTCPTGVRRSSPHGRDEKRFTWYRVPESQLMTDESIVMLIVRDAFIPHAIANRDPTRHAVFPLRWSFEDEQDRENERLSLALALGAGDRIPNLERLRYEFVVVYARLHTTRVRLASVVDSEFPWLIDNELLWQCAPPYAASRASLVDRRDLHV